MISASEKTQPSGLPSDRIGTGLPVGEGRFTCRSFNGGRGEVVARKWLARFNKRKHFLALVLIFFQLSCATDLEKIKKISIESDTISERGEQVKIHYSVQGKLKAKITALEVINHAGEETFTEFPKGVKLYSYDEALKATSQLTANYGIFYPKKEEMMVRDNVVIVNTKGELLNTEELIWKRKEEKIYSDKFVRITTPEEIIYGTGFEAKQDFSDYIIKNISGTVQIEDGQVPGAIEPGM